MVDPLAELARHAYARGWALSGGPMTVRVQAGAVAAASLAVEHAGHPAVVEATAELGYWEGVMAAVDASRDHLEAASQDTIGARWAAVLAAVDRPRLIRALKRRLAPAAAGPAPDGADPAAVAALITAALLRVADTHPQVWQQLRQAVRDAIASGQAEGRAAAITAAARKSRPGSAVDTKAARDDGLAALALVAVLWTQADQEIHTLAGYAARDLARAVTADGADDDDITAAVTAGLDGDDSRPVQAATVGLTGAAVIAGVVNLFAQAGINQVDVIAMPGACPRCTDVAALSPYRLGAMPDVPVHPYCRCEIHPTDQVLPDSLISPYVRPREDT